jgi:hypothetical protein
MYAESWSPKYATNKGQYRDADQYLIQYSFGYSIATDAGLPNSQAAVYQAREDISWPANSAQGFCSSLLGYTTPVVTITSATTTTPVSVTLQTVTVTSVGATTTAFSVSTTSTTITSVVGGKRRRAMSTPNVLTKYPASIVTSACSLVIKPVSSTSTVTVASTQTASTVLTTQQSSVTTLITSSVIVATIATATQVVQRTPTYKFVIADGPRAGQYITEDRYSGIGFGNVKTTSGATTAGNYKIGTASSVQTSDGLYHWVTSYDQGSYNILDQNAESWSVHDLALDDVLCSIASPAPASVTGAVGTISYHNCGSQIYVEVNSRLGKLFQGTSKAFSSTVAALPVTTCP